MPNTGTGRAAAEPPIGDQGDFVAQAHANNVAGGWKHFLHPRSAPWPFITNYHNVTSLNLASENAFAGFILTFKNHTRTFENEAGSAVRFECVTDARGFDHAARRS